MSDRCKPFDELLLEHRAAKEAFLLQKAEQQMAAAKGNTALFSFCFCNVFSSTVQNTKTSLVKLITIHYLISTVANDTKRSPQKRQSSQLVIYIK